MFNKTERVGDFVTEGWTICDDEWSEVEYVSGKKVRIEQKRERAMKTADEWQPDVFYMVQLLRGSFNKMNI